MIITDCWFLNPLIFIQEPCQIIICTFSLLCYVSGLQICPCYSPRQLQNFLKAICMFFGERVKTVVNRKKMLQIHNKIITLSTAVMQFALLLCEESLECFMSLKITLLSSWSLKSIFWAEIKDQTYLLIFIFTQVKNISHQS